MTFSGMSAADENAVGSQLERLKNKGGFYTTAAHHTDYSYVRCVFFSRSASQVGGSVGTPVAQESDYFGLVAHVITPSSCSMICFVVKCRLVIAPLGQAAAQVPQPLHKASFIVDTFFSSLNVIDK
jgi:hypothetical protein